MTANIPHLNFRERLAAFAAQPDECWLWPGGVGSHGYSMVWVDGVQELGHRAAYQLLVGPIPEDRVIDHLCRNRRCLNPRHMEVVVIRTNLRRGQGWSGRNAQKRRCLRDHVLEGANLRIDSNGSRQCRECDRIRDQRRRQRERAARSG